MIKALAFAGSTRQDSFNKKLARAVAAKAEQAGAEVTLIDLKEFPLPLFDQDLEAAEGLPENALRIKELMGEHDGLLLACPEYNSSITPVLKNLIDWVSRRKEGEAPLAAFTGKTAALFSTSPGALGGLRGLVHVRSILSSVGVLVLPAQVAVGGAFQAFDEEGALVDPKVSARVSAAVEAFVDCTRRLRSE
ncbi:MAG: NAD(P)H-dependent oxidoreductase [Deltaproteobacteria bacterium]|nr:NAD(P)H-dependent oxidoreductase [Deltaproteobacteria bacterium]